ncbi:hypothetical protein IWQ60_005549 [Tieghemiomyces parasiticus]|uniref:NmrA-like domain-containing protein n=1 Tax=Tieghemiomyces parasiticus TaxID=78921 RepID=A0A9W8DSZ2_9FUNG|nr:hypothetical protein IWQ60_005549 [Tieghemiomyces parasiticus]
MSSTKPVIVVVAATGKQGSGVVDALLDSNKFVVRALSRSIESNAAKALAARGVEVVQADIYSPTDLEGAFEGAYGIFFTTLFEMANKAPDHEVIQGKNVADAAQKAGVKHIVFSTLPSIRDISGGKYKDAVIFEKKAEVTAYIKSLGLPATFFNYGYFMTNTTRNPYSYRKVGVDSYELPTTNSVDAKMPVTDATGDAGCAVVKAFLNPAETIGQEYLIASGTLSLAEIAAEVARHTGKNVRAVRLSPEEAALHPFLRLPSIQEMNASIAEFGYSPHLSLESTIQTFGPEITFADFLAREKDVAFPE